MILVMTGIRSVPSGVFVVMWLVSVDLNLQSHPKDPLPKTSASINLDWVPPETVSETKI